VVLVVVLIVVVWVVVVWAAASAALDGPTAESA
jgi:hypothetical protein